MQVWEAAARCRDSIFASTSLGPPTRLTPFTYVIDRLSDFESTFIKAGDSETGKGLGQKKQQE